MPIRIPSEDQEALGELMRMPPESLAKVQAAIDRCQLQSRRGDLTDQVTEQLALQAGGFNAERVAKVLVSLYFLRASYEMTAAEVAEEVIDAIKTAPSPGYGELPKDLAASLKSLTQLLSNDSTLGLSVKASFLSYQSPRHIRQARIITDARPVFHSDPSSGPAAFVITHTLQIEYHEDGREREWFGVVDHEDLDTLAKAVERARTKEKTLRNSLTLGNVPVVDGD
jgi:hypothetical protein